MRRTGVRRRLVALVSVLVFPASLLVLNQSVEARQTPGQQAKRLNGHLATLEKAESALRNQAQAARNELLVGTAKWEAAKKKLAAAKKDAAEKTAQADEAKRQVEEKRRAVAQLAASTYQNPVDASLALASGVTSADPLEQARGMADLDQSYQQQVGKLEGYKAARIASDVFARQAKRAERKASSLEEALRKQTVELRAKAKKSTEALSRAVDKVNTVQSRIKKLQAAEEKRLAKIAAKKRAARAKTGQGGGGGGGPSGPRCSKSSRLNYPNGLIPQSALCPLPQSGWYLRADAARDFYKLNDAYRARFGSSICVNSAYRPLQRQYELYSTMQPGYAAVPGTSNHGWGKAVDLGCGINSFGTVQHNWMRSNAGRFGFFHPAWARSGPIEPWHWEHR